MCAKSTIYVRSRKNKNLWPYADTLRLFLPFPSSPVGLVQAAIAADLLADAVAADAQQVRHKFLVVAAKRPASNLSENKQERMMVN